MENQHNENLLPCYMYQDKKIYVVLNLDEYNEISNILRAKIKTRERYREYKRTANSKEVARRTRDLLLGPIQMVNE